ncbi:hypothetical protein [Rhodoblastus sp.]|uniref:hypothetical protein n=1 Tax=Rhodoblastus sp. TaxID=1962975 RepID=UPI0025F174A6|nr:hypothetical protein [Rhodoblastus sp.]
MTIEAMDVLHTQVVFLIDAIRTHVALAKEANSPEEFAAILDEIRETAEVIMTATTQAREVINGPFEDA